MQMKTSIFTGSANPPLSQNSAQLNRFDSSNCIYENGTRPSKLNKFKNILKESQLDIDALRKLSWSGIPDELRATIWKILLGYLPTNHDRQESTLERKRQEYKDCLPQYFDVPEDDYERGLLKQIHKDILRPDPSCPVFKNEIVQKSIERVLYVWAVRHPATGYVQGINDLVSPFFIVFLKSVVGPNYEEIPIEQIPSDVFLTIEADCYWCVSKLLDGIQDNYTFSQPGIQRMIFKLKELLFRTDAALAKHLDQQDPQFFLQFSFRWMNCLLMREIPLKLIIRMWDTYLSEPNGFASFHVYVCLSLLKHWSKKLQQMDFQDLFPFLQHLPTTNWEVEDIEVLLSEAFVLQTLYQDAPSHLRGVGE